MRPLIAGFETIIVVGLLFTGSTAWGQGPVTTPKGEDFSPLKSVPAKKTTPKTTIIEFELLQSSDGGGMHAQTWSKVLGPLDVSLRIHRPLLDDKPELKEREAGNLRYVTAVGLLDRSGQISFPDRSFTLSDSVKLKEWVTELRTYGVRGTPTGRPLWGLTREQFTLIYDGLIKPVEFDTEEMPLRQMVANLSLPPQYPLRWSADATAELARLGDRTKVRQQLKGFSTATALAVVLNDLRLGFRPNRTPSGEIELLVEPRNSKQEPWPIGWPLQRQNVKAAPKFFVMVPIVLSDVELSDVINGISKASETPILIDYAELDAKKIDLEKIKVSFPRKTTNWSIALSRMIVPQRLTQELWQDEAGRAFVLITTTRAGRPSESDRSGP